MFSRWIFRWFTRALRSWVPVLGALVLVAAPARAHTNVTPATLHDRIVAGDDIVVLDVREYTEFCGANGHIKDAVNFPWNTHILDTRLPELPADKDIVVVCGSGGRSNTAAGWLESQGLTRVFDMTGGMAQWSFDREACGAEPVLYLWKGAGTVEIDIVPATGTQDYDLLSGLQVNVADAGTTIDLGPITCHAKATGFSFFSAPDPPDLDTVFFFLARTTGLSWGRTWDGKERVPGSPECD